MGKSNISYNVELYLNDVALSVTVDKKLKGRDDVLKNFGHITVGGWADGERNCFWDGLNLFIEGHKKGIKEECERELRIKGYNPEDTLKDVRRLIKRALKMGLLKLE